MRIAFLGNFTVDYCSEVHYKKTLEAMGHEIIPLQENVVSNDEVLAQAKEADVFVWVHSHGHQNNGTVTMTQVLEQLKALNIPSVAYHLDLYMGLERWKDYESSEYFKVEHFFTVDKLMADWLNENTQTKGHFLEAGVYEPECYLEYNLSIGENRVPIFKHDVIFVGSKGYHKEWMYRPMLLNWLAGTYKEGFAQYGNDGVKLIRGDELNRTYAESKVTVGDSLNMNFNYPYYSSDRFFEATGRGAFLIYPKIEGFAPEYEDGVHVAYYEHGNFRNLQEKIDYYLTHDEERERIRLAGHKLTKEKNTYTQRWQTILDTVK